jgi:hypothetical protein
MPTVVHACNLSYLQGRQEDDKFEARVGYIARLCHRNKSKNKDKTKKKKHAEEPSWSLILISSGT